MPLVMGVEGIESEKWSPLRGSHCLATTPH